MLYQNRKRSYKSRRERFERDKRVIKILLMFGGIVLGLWLFMNRHDWIGYLKTYFY